MNILVKNGSQKDLVKKLMYCAGNVLDQTDISAIVGLDFATIAMLLRIDELLGVLDDQNVVLGEEDLNALNQHLVNLEKIKSSHEELYESEEIVGNLLSYLRKILASSAHSRNGTKGV